MSSYLTLPITPSYGSDFSQKARRFQNQFGDGYSQTAVDGLIATAQTLNLEWNALSLADKESLCENFFELLAGSTPFYYTPYGQANALLWKCSDWDVTPLSSYTFKVSATIKQSFDITNPIIYIPPGGTWAPLIKDLVTGGVYLIGTESGVPVTIPSSNTTTIMVYYLIDVANNGVYALTCSSGVLELQAVDLSFFSQAVAYAVADQITGGTYQIVSDNGDLAAELI